ncbi:MAG: hypothetical protein QOF70_7400, partial [Acetobacteraceae bacterium]|nr:hypothetical protein [Acetobacteraceae bacterium]
MNRRPMSLAIARRLQQAAQSLGTVNPLPAIGGLLERTFPLPEGDRRYAENALTPGAAPFEPSFSELQPGVLRFTVEPLAPDASGVDRRDEGTREMRRLVGDQYGRDALRWFDGRSEAWRGLGPVGRMDYGAFFGTSYDRDGLYASKIYYETKPNQIESLPRDLLNLTNMAVDALPRLHPLFTTIACQRHQGGQRLTFLHRSPLKLSELRPLLEEIDLQHQLPGIMQIIGLALGGRFELPENAALISMGVTPEGPEFEIYVLMGMIPDVPPNFLDLLTLGLSERPRELTALIEWLRAYTPESGE